MDHKVFHSIKNSLILFVRMIFIMVITLYSSRVLIDVLGIESYGIYDIVAGIVILFTVLNSALTSAVQRFLNITVEDSDKSRFNKYFNISLLVFVLLSLFLFFIGYIFSEYVVHNFLKIPENKKYIAIILFKLSLLNLLFQILRVPFTAILFAYERLGFHSVISVFEAIGKLIVVLSIPFLNYDYLINYSTLLVFLTIFINITYIAYLYQVHLLPKFFLVSDLQEYKIMLSFSSYSLLGGVTSMLNQQSNAILLNRFFGVILNAANGVVNQVNAALFQIMSSIQNAFSPLLMKYFMEGDQTKIKDIFFLFTRLNVSVYLIIAIPLLVLTPEILNFWLVQVPPSTVAFTRLMIIGFLFDVLSMPLWTLVHAEGNIKRYQVVISIIILVNIFVAWFVLSLTKNPLHLWYVKILGAILIYLYRYLYIRKIVNHDFNEYFSGSLRYCIQLGFCLGLSLIVYEYFGNIFIYLISYIIVLFFSIFYCALSRNEQIFIISKFLGKR